MQSRRRAVGEAVAWRRFLALCFADERDHVDRCPLSTQPAQSPCSYVVEAQLTPVAATLPNLNSVPAPGAKPLPAIVTVVPPAIGPVAGLTPVTVGDLYLNTSALTVALVPPGPVTVTSALPAVPGGAVAVIEVAELTTKLAAVAPKWTALAPREGRAGDRHRRAARRRARLRRQFATLGGPAAAKRCLHVLPSLLHSCWYQYSRPLTSWL